MRLALTGASGFVGGFLAEGLRARGHRVTTLGRRGADLPFALGGTVPDLSGHDALIHAALEHVPGAYRGGEGDDPDRFVAANRDGSIALFEAARAAGLGRIVFLSSRAVYGPQPAGVALTEATPARPDTLYGEVKLDCERWLADCGVPAVSVRATGIYGPVPGHKWERLFADYLAGRPVAPRVGTELHGEDMAAAVALLLSEGAGVYNASDLLLDRRELLALVQARTGCPHPLPARADARGFNVMDTTRLEALGWRPGGWERLERTVDWWFRG